ncbi:MAG: alpha/beta fold hydrolase [Chitinophagaceae bacterium]|nr:MAG: alpha/beta fold hydrolase [Chitinophagaceae bacterium]
MRRIVRRLLWFVIILFVLLNGIAALHAWHFTHFDGAITNKTSEKGLSFGQKLKLAFTGVRMPRPRNERLPDTSFQTVLLQNDQRLEAWWIPVAQPKGSVLLLHGYGGSKEGMIDKARIFRQFGYNTLLLDFRGAGGSSGNQCTIGYKEAADTKAAYDFLYERGERNIYLFGSSMGAAAAMRALAVDSMSVRGAILECPFASMLQTVQNRFHMQGAPTFPLAQLLVFWGGTLNGFNAFAHKPEDYAAKVNCPVLLMWGEQDPKVMRFETAHIFSRLAGPKKLVTFPGAGHENYLGKYRTEWMREVANFLNPD